MFRTLETELSSLRMYSCAKNKKVSLSSESISATKVPFWQSTEKKKEKKRKNEEAAFSKYPRIKILK